LAVKRAVKLVVKLYFSGFEWLCVGLSGFEWVWVWLDGVWRLLGVFGCVGVCFWVETRLILRYFGC
jgi:hypothetical protein